MAGEHVKGAKQATGVRATLQTYTNKVVKRLNTQGWQKTLLEKTYCNNTVTIIPNTRVTLLSCYAILQKLKLRCQNEQRREREPKVVHASFMQLLKLEVSAKHEILYFMNLTLFQMRPM